MESILKDHIVDYLTVNDIILKSQHGFMKKRSCLTNLLEYLENLSDLVDKGHSVDVVYLDFSKAFDKVPHERLAVMLQAHGIGGHILEWIKSWLRGRKQRVVLNGSFSRWIQVCSGVPQGSVLGPLLFIIFINLFDHEVGILEILSKYADDTKVGGVVDEPEQIENLQIVLNRIMQWADSWQMVFNKEKCHVMHLGRKNPRHYYTMGGHAPGGQVLDKSKWEEDLGVIVSDDLKPSKQCLAASKKANSTLGRMARSFSYRSKDVWLRLYRIYVRPILEYAVQAWSPWLAKDIKVLEDVQRRAIRMTSGLKGKTYEERLLEVGMPTLQDRRIRGDAIQTWKTLNRHDDVDEKVWFERFADGQHRDTRLSTCELNLKPKCFNLDVRKNVFSARSVNIWNNIPVNTRKESSLNIFKQKYDEMKNY